MSKAILFLCVGGMHFDVDLRNTIRFDTLHPSGEKKNRLSVEVIAELIYRFLETVVKAVAAAFPCTFCGPKCKDLNCIVLKF